MTGEGYHFYYLVIEYGSSEDDLLLAESPMTDVAWPCMRMIVEERWLLAQLTVALKMIWRLNGSERARPLVIGWAVCKAL